MIRWVRRWWWNLWHDPVHVDALLTEISESYDPLRRPR